ETCNLVTIFPNVENFEFYQTQFNSTLMVKILSGWPKLRSVKITIINSHLNPNESEWKRVLDSLSTISSLRHLSVCTLKDARDLTLDLPNFAQLESLYFGFRISNVSE